MSPAVIKNDIFVDPGEEWIVPDRNESMAVDSFSRAYLASAGSDRTIRGEVSESGKIRADTRRGIFLG